MQTFDPAASKQEFLKAAVNFWTLFNQMCHVGKIKLRFSEIQSIKNMNVILLTVCYCMAAALFCLSQNLGSQQSSFLWLCSPYRKQDDFTKNCLKSL